MKVKVLLCLLFVAPMSLILSSYENGPEHHSGWDGTGATGSTGCSNGGGCHNSTTSLNTAVELDSAGVSVSSYQPGQSYTIKISATNNTTGTFGYFGFQLTTVMDSNAGTTGAIQAGTWGTQLPTDVQNSTPTIGRATVPVIEHNTHIPALSGSGGVGTTYGVAIPWTAPAAGSGPIQIYGVINAVTGLDIAFLCDYQAATPVTITEATVTGINSLPANLYSFSVYPTMMNDNVTVAFELAETAAVRVTLVSLDGQIVRTLVSQELLGVGNFKRSFDVDGLATGVYLMRLQIGNESVVTKVVKE